MPAHDALTQLPVELGEYGKQVLRELRHDLFAWQVEQCVGFNAARETCQCSTRLSVAATPQRRSVVEHGLERQLRSGDGEVVVPSLRTWFVCKESDYHVSPVGDVVESVPILLREIRDNPLGDIRGCGHDRALGPQPRGALAVEVVDDHAVNVAAH